MAKEQKGAPLSLDNYDFGSEFDFDEFDMTPKPVKNNREAVERIAGGALEGVADTFKSPSFFRDMIRKALPRGYGNMLDIADTSASTIRELYNEGAKEIKPALKDTARVVDRLLPSGAKYLPKSVEGALKKFADAQRDKAQIGPAEGSRDDLAVATILQDTFRVNAQLGARREAKEDVQRGIQETIENNRHEDTVGQLEGIRRGVVSMAAYQKRIEFKFQQKSLELQARSYFVQVDMLNETKRQNVRNTEMLTGILKNTALPDILKMKASEKFMDMMRNKAFGGLQDGIFGQRADFMRRLGGAFKDQAMGSIRNLAQGVRDGANGLESAADSAAMADDMGMDRFRMMGNMVGSQGAQWAAGLGATRIGQRIQAGGNGRMGRVTKGIRRLGNRMQFGAENLPQLASDFSNSATDGDELANRLLDNTVGDRMSATNKRRVSGVLGTIGNPILDLLRGTIKRANMEDTDVKSTGLNMMQQPSAFTNQAHRSLVEVIPGYLARIYQELQITRTGDQSIDLAQYDFGKGAFSNTKTVRKALFNKVFDETSRKGVKQEQERLLEMVDPAGVLDPKQREELAKILMNDNLRGRAGYETGRVTNYLNASNFGESQNGGKFAELFQNLNKKRKEEGEYKTDLDFSARFRNVGASMTGRKDDIQRILEIYPRETLEDMGIIKPGSDKLDMQKVYEYFGGEEYNPRGEYAQGGFRIQQQAGRARRGLGGPQLPPQLPQPSGPRGGSDESTGNPVVAELQRLIDLVESQNTRPLTSEIKDILLEMQQAARDGGVGEPAGPSRIDQLRNLADSAGQAGRRARRQAQVRAGRLLQQNQPRIDELREQGGQLMGDLQERGGELMEDLQERGEEGLSQAGKMARRARRKAFLQAGRLRQRYQGDVEQLGGRVRDFGQSQLERGQDLWANRISGEQLREMITERLRQTRGQAGAAFDNLRNGSQGLAGRLSQGMRDGAQRLQEGQQDNSSTDTLLGEIKDVLLGIQERLEDGLMVMNMPDGGVPPGLIRRGANAVGGGIRKVGRGIRGLNMRISDVAKGMFNLTKGTAKLGGRMVNGLVGGSIRTAWGLGKGVAGLASDGVGAVVGSQYRRARGFLDIYVGSERKPRLYGRILQEGNTYFDQETGKPIRRLKDITGTVVRRKDGVDEVVLEADEIANAYQRVGPIKKTLKAMGVVVKSAYGLGKGIAGAVLGAIPPMFRLAFSGVKKVWGVLDMAQDIYVKDQLDSPALTARIMRAGGYVSAASGEIVNKPSKIDGPVMSGDETVLTHDDIRKGLVDRNNKPIRTGLSKLTNFMFGGLKTAGKLAWKAGKMVNAAGTGLVKGGFKLGKKLARGAVLAGGGAMDIMRLRNPFSNPAEVNAQTVQVAAASNSLLGEIRDLLRDRLPERKRVRGDVDGDGDRDGSYADQMAQKKAKEKAEAEAAQQSGAPGAGVGGQSGMLASLWAKLRGKKNEENEDEEGGDTNIELDGDGNDRDKKRRRRMARRPGGSWGTSQGWKAKARFLGGKGLGALKGAGRLGLGLVGGGLGIGSMLGGVGTALAGAGTAIAGGAAAVGGALATGAAALAGIISAPVVLGALAVAAVGVGAYYGYKYLTRKKLGLLSRIRYAQYGFTPNDTDHVQGVFGLEDKLKDALIYGKEGAKLDAKRVKPEDIMKFFDVEESDKAGMAKLTAWFANRFKPVFLTHASALKGIAGDKWLSDVDELDPAIALKYMNATRFPEGPYSVDTSPFKDLKSLPASGGDVRALIKIAEEELQKKAKGSAGKAGVAGAAGVVAATGMAGKSVETPPANPQIGSGIPQDVLKQAAATASMGAGAYTGGQVGVSASGKVLSGVGSGVLDGLDVVRMKSYGLVKMEVDKVRALQALEQSVQENISYSKSIASWTGSLEHILNGNGAAFGVDITSEGLAANWLNWFNQRFLPVYLNYATLIKAQTGKDKPEDGKMSLKPTQIVDVATAIFTTTGSAGGVWNISVSPWSEYELNVDVRSTDGNMQGLKDQAKAAVMPEPGGKSNNQPNAKNGSAASSATYDGTQKLGGIIGGIGSMATSAWSGLKSMGQGIRDAVMGPSQVGGTGGGSGGGAGFGGGGAEITHQGKGTGGDINAIPKPTGNKSWASVKDTILAAAKMVGVDGKLMATMAAIESGFDHSVKAGTSSATGLYQFISSTWNMMVKKYGPKYGIAPGTPATDPRANALLGAEYVKLNFEAMNGKIGRPVTDTDIYMAHFLGSGGAKKFFRQDPNAIAANVMPKEAAANRSIFWNGQTPRTIGEVYQLMASKVRNKAKMHDVGNGGEALVASAAKAATAKPGELPPASETGKAAPAGSKGAPSAPATSAYAVGAVVAGTASAPAVTPEPAPSAPTNRGVAIGGTPMGFTAPRPMQDQMAAAKLSSEIRVSNLADTNKLLETSNGIQEKMLGVLGEIRNNIGNLGAAPADARPADATPTSQAARAAERRTTELPKAPVSVARPRAPY